MSKKKLIFSFMTGFILFMIILSLINPPKSFIGYKQDNYEYPHLSASLDGIDNILILDPDRTATMIGYGLVNIEDIFIVKNQNNNPITSIFIGIPPEYSDDLIFFKARGLNDNSLLIERSNILMNDYEMLSIYFDSPLLPQQERTIKFITSFRNLLNYSINGTNQQIDFTGNIFPIFPYRAEGDVKSLFIPPTEAIELNFEHVGEMGVDTGVGVLYDIIRDPALTFIEPFLGNLNEDQKEVTITFEDDEAQPDSRFTKMEMEEINREILISPWGVIKVKDDFLIHNKGVVDIFTFSLKIPEDAKNLYVSDELGQLLGTEIDEESDLQNYDDLIISLGTNRAKLTPDSKFRFTVEYDLPFEKYYSSNWLQQSIEIDIFTTIHDYLGEEQTINLIIEGCNTIEFISNPPFAIEESQSTKIIVYEFNNVSPLERKLLQFTYSVDLFNLLLRPIILLLIIALIASVYVLIVKLKRGEEGLTLFKKEVIPVNEIREFCYLYEEMNALILEIRKTEDDAKHKKVAKKQYKNILTKNSAKIEQIKQEIIPFKQTLTKTNETFENIVKKLDVLDAERVSVNDSLNLLESRYKRGKLPSKAAYQKLSNDFMDRRKKIDRTIDKLVQQLRSYLL